MNSMTLNISSRSFSLMLVMFLSVIWLGCPKDEYGLKNFDHKEHSEEVDDCELCHEISEDSPHMVPGHEICESCHEFDMEEPDKNCLVCHSLPKGMSKKEAAKAWAKFASELDDVYKHQRSQAKELRGDVIFDHGAHENVKCEECHGDVMKGESKETLVMKKCEACHRSMEVVNECETCHKVLREDVEPQSHNLNWKKVHGMESRIADDQCNYCHTQSFCDDCHRTEKPDSHNAFFRKRGHGFFVENNRRSCLACHQSDFCESCHLEVEPRNHTSSFKNKNHCQSCHFPIRKGTGCQVCHMDIVHPNAEPFPHPVNSRQSCQPCHTGNFVKHSTVTVRSNQCGSCHAQIGAKTMIDHPIDLSVNCNLCHSSSIVPHSLAGQSERDCLQCHIAGPVTPISGNSPNPPHTLRGVPFSSCNSCHAISRAELRVLMRNQKFK